jgi:hypothetical protein
LASDPILSIFSSFSLSLSLSLSHLGGQGSLFFESRKYASKNRRFYFYFENKFMIDVQYFFNPSILGEKTINIKYLKY